jgi:DNA-binding response OmpR family regulator
MKVLVVEDDVLIANYIKYVLEKNKYYVTGIADSVANVKESIRLSVPDVALLDIRLSSGESGIAVSEYLVKEDVPFMYLTANNDRDTMSNALKTNPVAYITKPFNEDNVVAAIELFRQTRAEKA